MADPFVAEIRIFPFGFAPRGWSVCDGQVLPISQNTALFSLVGTYYGGNGQSTFGLPNLQGKAPMAWGDGPGLTSRVLGEEGGQDTVTLIYSEMPAHTHGVQANANVGDTNSPSPNVSLARSVSATAYRLPAGQNLAGMADPTIMPSGESQPHENRQPYLTLLFCLAMQGVFPPRG